MDWGASARQMRKAGSRIAEIEIFMVAHPNRVNAWEQIRVLLPAPRRPPHLHDKLGGLTRRGEACVRRSHDCGRRFSGLETRNCASKLPPLGSERWSAVH